MTTDNRLVSVYVGEKRLLEVSPGVRPSGALRSGQTITTVVWTPESPVTMVGGSDEIVQTQQASDTARARFDFTSAVAGERYTITAKMTTTNPIEEIVEHRIAQILVTPA